MIMITSAAGVRLARAGHAYQPYHTPKVVPPPSEGSHYHSTDLSPNGHILMQPIVEAAERELIDAAMAVAKELIANRHHLQEGD